MAPGTHRAMMILLLLRVSPTRPTQPYHSFIVRCLLVFDMNHHKIAGVDYEHDGNMYYRKARLGQREY